MLSRRPSSLPTERVGLCTMADAAAPSWAWEVLISRAELRKSSLVSGDSSQLLRLLLSQHSLPSKLSRKASLDYIGNGGCVGTSCRLCAA